MLYRVLFLCLCLPWVSLLAQAPNHSAWDSMLKLYVSKGSVNYKAWLADRTGLDTYLKALSAVESKQYANFSQTEKLAFLINAYNAFTIQLILDHYPVKSITEICGPFAKINLARGAPWKKDFFVLLGEKRTLDWIEHEKLRVDFQEPRIHFAIVCASVGCPELASEAYRADKLDSQLQRAKLGFLSNPDKNRYDSQKNVLYLSPIFDWFKADFTKKSTLVEFVQDGFSEKIRRDALIELTEYSWKLNEQKTTQSLIKE